MVQHVSILMQRFNSVFTWTLFANERGRPQAWARGGALAPPGKVEKCYRVKRSISEVSLDGRDAIGLCVCNCMLCKLNSLLI